MRGILTMNFKFPQTSIGLLTALLVLVASTAAAATNEAQSDIAALRTAFKKSLVEYDETAESGLRACANEYLNDLVVLSARLQKAGDLDNWEIVNAEQQRVSSQKGLLAAPDLSSAKSPLRGPWEKYSASVDEIRHTQSKQTLNLANRYLGFLDGLKKKRTQEGSFTSAREAKDEMDAVTNLAQIVAASGYMTARANAGFINRITGHIPNAPPPAPRTAPLPAAFTKNLLLFYDCAKRDEKTVADLSGHKRDGHVVGAKWISKGVSGGGYEFDGNNDYIDLDPNNDMSMAIGEGDFTAALWVEFKGSGTTQSQLLEAHTQGGSWTGIYLSYESESIRFRTSDSGGPASSIMADAGKMIGDGKMHCLIAMRENGSISLHIDGQLKERKRAPMANLRTRYAAGLRFGAHSEQGHLANFKGTFHQLMIFDRALSDSEIKQLTALRR